MSKRKNKSDEDQLANAMVEAISSGNIPMTADGKNPIAVALGRLGGLKGGHARAASLTAAQRSQSAKKAAQARWAQRAGE